MGLLDLLLYAFAAYGLFIFGTRVWQTFIRWLNSVDYLFRAPKPFKFSKLPPNHGTPLLSDSPLECTMPISSESLGWIDKSVDLETIFSKARKAQLTWKNSSFKTRRRVLLALLEATLKFQREICEVCSQDSGKTLLDCHIGEILPSCEKLNCLIKNGEAWLAREYRPPGRSVPHKIAYLDFHPVGVMGAIIPFNYPFHNLMNPLSACIMAGNTLVVKCSEHTAYASKVFEDFFRRIFVDLGCPADLIQVVYGGPEEGKEVCRLADKLIFIGSTTVGRTVMSQCATYLTPVILELGGKDCVIVTEDVNIPDILPSILRGCFQGSGQNCMGAERVLVQSRVYEEFVEMAAYIIGQMSAGKNGDLGALCLPGHIKHLQDLVDEAIKQGAKVAGKGGLITPSDNCFAPIMLTGVTSSMRIWREETFGPILIVREFENDLDAVRLSNDSDFGLGSAVFCDNISRAETIASDLNVGMTAINDFATFYMCQWLPTGGVKDSGFGCFSGIEGLRGFCRSQSVCKDRVSWCRTKLPRALQYPVEGKSLDYAENVTRLLFGFGVADKLWSLIYLARN